MTEVYQLRRADRCLTLTAGRSVVSYSGRYAPMFPSPMVFAGTCACPRWCRTPGQAERDDKLTLAEYAGGPVELIHVDVEHVGAVRQSDYQYLIGEQS